MNETYNVLTPLFNKNEVESMVIAVREAMCYELGMEVPYETLYKFFSKKGNGTLPGCQEWQACFAVEKMLEYFHNRVRDNTLAKMMGVMPNG